MFHLNYNISSTDGFYSIPYLSHRLSAVLHYNFTLHQSMENAVQMKSQNDKSAFSCVILTIGLKSLPPSVVMHGS